MLNSKLGLRAVGLGAVAAIASAAVAWPSAIAQSSVKITTKQAALLGVAATVPASEETVSTLIVKMRASGSQLVQVQGGAYVRSLANMTGLGVKSVRQMSDSTSLVALDSPMRMSDAKVLAARLASDPAVEYVEPDVAMRPSAVPNEPDFQFKQWNLYPPLSVYTGSKVVAMGAPPATHAAPAAGAANLIAAWDRTKGVDTVVVAVIDTGIVNHPDLNGLSVLGYTAGGRFLAGHDFVSADALGLPANFVANDGGGRDTNPLDPGDNVSAAERANPLCNDNTPNQQNVNANSTWHGTHTAGVVAATADNTTGIAGIGWNVKVLPVRALGKCGGAMSDVADAILWSAGLSVTTAPVPPTNTTPARVILVGAGGKAGVTCSQTLQSAIDAAIAAGSVVVAATGNEGVFELSAPANCNGVIAVTAHAINGENATYSNIAAASGGAQVSVSAAGGGSPASLGSSPGGPSGIDDPTWDGYYIWSTAPSGAQAAALPMTYSGRFGTSPAAAQVAGVAALIKSLTPTATPAQVKSAIMTSARPFPELSSCAPGRTYAGRCGTGMLDANRALQAAGPPVIVTAPAAVSVAVGATASFTVDAIGVVSYQWTRAGVPIAGATSASYTTPALAATDNNVGYTVVMTNSFGNTTSPAAVVTVTGGANAPSGGGALPLWQLLLMSGLLLAGRVRVGYNKQ